MCVCAYVCIQLAGGGNYLHGVCAEIQVFSVQNGYVPSKECVCMFVCMYAARCVHLGTSVQNENVPFKEYIHTCVCMYSCMCMHGATTCTVCGPGYKCPEQVGILQRMSMYVCMYVCMGRLSALRVGWDTSVFNS